jgi:hypothetical protein
MSWFKRRSMWEWLIRQSFTVHLFASSEVRQSAIDALGFGRIITNPPDQRLLSA